MHLDAADRAIGDRNVGAGRIISFSGRLQNVGLHYRMPRSGCAGCALPSYRQVYAGAFISGDFGHIYTIPGQPAFPRAHLFTRYGESRALRGLPFGPKKIHAEGHGTKKLVTVQRFNPIIHGMQEFTMSSLNGDKSRFNRERKQKLARRKRNRKLMDATTAPGKSAPDSSAAKQKPVSA